MIENRNKLKGVCSKGDEKYLRIAILFEVLFNCEAQTIILNYQMKWLYIMTKHIHKIGEECSSCKFTPLISPYILEYNTNT